MAKLTESNKHLNSEEKLTEQVLRSMIGSSAIEGIRLDEQTLRDHLKKIELTRQKDG